MIRMIMSIFSTPPWPLLLAVSLLSWLALAMHNMGAHVLSMQHAMPMDMAMNAMPMPNMPIQTALDQAVHWLIMMVAMMMPLLANPIRFLWQRNFARMRYIAITTFIVSYLMIWGLAGVGILSLVHSIQQLSSSTDLAVFIAFGLALLWQISPTKQYCLNHCHLRIRINPFGWLALRDSCRYGVVMALWCVGTCWALMLLPMALTHCGFLCMIIVSVVMYYERLQPARPIGWRMLRL